MKASVPFNETSRELLKDPETAVAYLADFLEEEDLALFRFALRQVAETHFGDTIAFSETTYRDPE